MFSWWKFCQTIKQYYQSDSKTARNQRILNKTAVTVRKDAPVLEDWLLRVLIVKCWFTVWKVMTIWFNFDIALITKENGASLCHCLSHMLGLSECACVHAAGRLLPASRVDFLAPKILALCAPWWYNSTQNAQNGMAAQTQDFHICLFIHRNFYFSITRNSS